MTFSDTLKPQLSSPINKPEKYKMTRQYNNILDGKSLFSFMLQSDQLHFFRPISIDKNRITLNSYKSKCS